MENQTGQTIIMSYIVSENPLKRNISIMLYTNKSFLDLTVDWFFSISFNRYLWSVLEKVLE